MPEGKSKFAYGNINKVKKSKIIYHIATAPGSSGAPLLDQNCRALAIHRAGDSTNADLSKSLADQADLRRMASLLSNVVNGYFFECPTLYAFHLVYLALYTLNNQNQNLFLLILIILKQKLFINSLKYTLK